MNKKFLVGKFLFASLLVLTTLGCNDRSETITETKEQVGEEISTERRRGGGHHNGGWDNDDCNSGTYTVSTTVTGQTMNISIDRSNGARVKYVMLQVKNCDGSYLNSSDVISSNYPVSSSNYYGGGGSYGGHHRYGSGSYGGGDGHHSGGGDCGDNNNGCSFNNSNSYIKIDNLDNYCGSQDIINLSITFDSTPFEGNMILKSCDNCLPFTLNFTPDCGFGFNP